MPLPPVIQNKEVEISGCDVNLTWSASQESSCPLTMFTIYYHEIASPLKEHAGHEINVSSVTKTSFLLSLQCDKQYGFEISAWNDAGESDKSRLWPIMTRSGSENVTLFHGTGMRSVNSDLVLGINKCSFKREVLGESQQNIKEVRSNYFSYF